MRKAKGQHRAPKRQARRDAAAGETLERVVGIRREHLIDASQPLVLIAQPNRSGGTLLSQLLDAHPELHVHPAELKIGAAWPALDLAAAPGVWFKALAERHLPRAFREGYAKDKPAEKLGYEDQLQRLPFILPPSLHRELFLALADDQPCKTQRDVLDRYFTALFNSWLDNQNLYAGPKRWTVVFRGRMRHHLAEFFTDYPDGRHVTCVRDAKGIIASKYAWREQRKPLDYAITFWRQYVEAGLEARERYGPDKVFVMTFSQLVTETDATMRKLAEWLGIRFDPVLATPTFNRLPIRANSSFRVNDHGVIRQPLENWRHVLSESEADLIDAHTRDLYERVEVIARLSRAEGTSE